MKYGFVYIWYDRKHRRYYVGCHWGCENDGYICSSPWMKQAYNKRPADFKRRIISRIYTTRKDMFEEEARWHNFIRDDELRVRYYNIRRHGEAHWSTNDEKYKTVSEKISHTMKSKHNDPEYRRIYEEGQLKRDYTKEHSIETREKRRRSLIGKNVGKKHQASLEKAWAAARGSHITEEHKNRIREAGAFRNLNSKRIKCKYCEFVGNPGSIGRYHNEKCKNK